MSLNEHTAKIILDAAHRAWSDGDLGRLLGLYTEDIDYLCNTVDPDGPPLKLRGRESMEAFLSPIVAVSECLSVTDGFQYHAGIARVRIACSIKHKQTGHSVSGTYRQIVMFRNSQICRLEEFHDAAKMAAFWRLVDMDISYVSAR
jgi:ketosteroid isomerase-like protein